jgi:hypothetical protein
VHPILPDWPAILPLLATADGRQKWWNRVSLGVVATLATLFHKLRKKKDQWNRQNRWQCWQPR